MSNTVKRVIVGAIGIPLIFILIYAGGYYLFALTILLQTLCLWEFFAMFEKKEFFPLKYISLFFSLVISFIAFFKIYFFIPCVLIYILFLISAEIFRKEKRSPLNASLSLFGIFYITIPFIMLNQAGKNFYLILSIFLMIWSCDIFAFFGGKLFGKHKLTAISPGKTIEGSITGFVFTMITAFILFYFSNGTLVLMDFLVLGFITGVLSQFGDIFESMLKRFCGVKDSSNIIPGHGGVLDRFDSLIFILPFIYLYFNYVK